MMSQMKISELINNLVNELARIGEDLEIEKYVCDECKKCIECSEIKPDPDVHIFTALRSYKKEVLIVG